MITRQKALVAAMLILIWGVVLAVLYTTGAVPAIGDLLGPDSYMRMLRVEHLQNTAAWYDHTISRSNAPFGETLHWSRPLDVLILAGSLPLWVFLPLKDALYWSAYSISPVLLLFAAGGLVWAARPIMDVHGRAIAAALMLSSPALFLYTGPGRADHHGLILLALVLLMGSTWRALTSARIHNACAGVLVGGAAGLAMWVSLELVWAVTISVFAITVDWIWRGDTRRRNVDGCFVALCLILALAVAIETAPAGWFVPVYDKISVVHVTFAAVGLAAWTGFNRLRRRIRVQNAFASRLVVATAAAVAGLGVGIALFPAVLAGPMAEIDPAVRALWLDHVAEMRPLWPADPTEFAQWADLLRFLLPALIGVPFLCRRIIHTSGGQRGAWLYLAVLLAAAAFLAAQHLRFAIYVGLLAAPVLGDAVVWAFRRSRNIGLVGRAPLRAATVVAFVIGPPLSFVMLSSAISSEAESRDRSQVNLTRLAVFLNSLPLAGDGETPVALAHLDIAPEIMWRTQLHVVGTPYHRNSAGIRDTHRMLAATDDDVARRLFARRGIDLVVLIGGFSEKNAYGHRNRPDSLYARLMADDPPKWLEPLALPPDLEDAKIYIRPKSGE